MEIKVIKNAIPRTELTDMAIEEFNNIVKAVVDINQEIMAVGGELHADEEVLLNQEYGSERKDLWGINLLPKNNIDDWIEFDSMINFKPHYGNRSRGVDDISVQEKIKLVVKKLVTE